MFDCDNSIKCITNSKLFYFQNKGIHQIRMTNMNFFLKTVFIPCLRKWYQLVNALVKSHEACWILEIVSCHSLYQARCLYLTVKGFRSEKGTSSPVGSLSTASLAALSAASFPPIPTCPGPYMEIIFFWSTSISCNISGICINKEWSVFTCPALAKQKVNLKTKSWFYFPETGCLLESK